MKPSHPVIDTVQIEAIASGVPEMVLEILEDFRTGFGDDLGKLCDGLPEDKASSWREFFHRGKGSGSTLGLVALQESCAKLEKEAQEGIVPSKETLNELEALVKESCDQAAEFLRKL